MRIFLSYHSPDAALALALKQALEANHADAEVFFAPQSLRAGNFFVPQLGTALDDADAILRAEGSENTPHFQSDQATRQSITHPKTTGVEHGTSDIHSWHFQQACS